MRAKTSEKSRGQDRLDASKRMSAAPGASTAAAAQRVESGRTANLLTTVRMRSARRATAIAVTERSHAEGRAERRRSRKPVSPSG